MPISEDFISSLPHATKYIWVINDKFLNKILSIDFKYILTSCSIFIISDKYKGTFISSIFFIILSFLLIFLSAFSSDFLILICLFKIAFPKALLFIAPLDCFWTILSFSKFGLLLLLFNSVFICSLVNRSNIISFLKFPIYLLLSKYWYIPNPSFLLFFQ